MKTPTEQLKELSKLLASANVHIRRSMEHSSRAAAMILIEKIKK